MDTFAHLVFWWYPKWTRRFSFWERDNKTRTGLMVACQQDKSSTKFKWVSTRWSLGARCAMDTCAHLVFWWYPKRTRRFSFWERDNKTRMVLMVACQRRGILCWKKSCGSFWSRECCQCISIKRYLTRRNITMKEKKNCKNLDHESWVLTFKLSLTFIWSIFHACGWGWGNN